jgi:hypothetical protein
MDSVAASLVMPRSTENLFLDRIPRVTGRRPAAETLIDLVHQRALLARLSQNGVRAHTVAADQEFLYRPYPIWHSDQSILAACYLADSLGLSTIHVGSVLDSFRFRGYLGDEQPRNWRFDTRAKVKGQELFRTVGLERGAPVLGCTEVGTVIIVNSSPYRGRTTSCYYPSPEPFCMRCDKCFKKLLLTYVVEDRPVPSELFERFVSQPALAGIFARPYFDWHHVWYYLFQRIRCRHWYAQELHRQAARGPDVSVLAKWYPTERRWIPRSCRGDVVENIGRHLETMTATEVEYLENLDVPPLHAPKGPPSPRNVGRGSTPRPAARSRKPRRGRP